LSIVAACKVAVMKKGREARNTSSEPERTLTKLVLPEFCNPTTVISISLLQNNPFSQSSQPENHEDSVSLIYEALGVLALWCGSCKV
jgi:hypothetical protein